MFDLNEVRHIAELSKLEFSNDELTDVMNDMNEIVNIMDIICDFDNRITEYRLNAIKCDDLRDGETEKSCATEVITSNSAKVENNAFIVPRVI